jgi:hypothetical protein
MLVAHESFNLVKTSACLKVIFWSPWISHAERSRSSFALTVFYVRMRNCFLLSVILTRVVNGKSKSMRVGLRTGILSLRVLMDGILF